MEHPMEFLSAPQANLHTWSNVVRLITWSCAAIVILLIVLALILL